MPLLDTITQALRSLFYATIPRLSSPSFNFWTILDIFIITIIIYFILKVIQASKALQLFQGLAVFFVFLIFLDYLSGSLIPLSSLNWLVRITMQILPASLPILLAILFQPELRKAIGSLGQKSIFGKAIDFMEQQEINNLVNEISTSVSHMSNKRHGALIAIERQVGLADYEAGATKIDAQVTSALLESIFFPGTALHDGGVTIKGDRITFARCVFPLSHDTNLEQDIGTRHRAAVGLSEETDAIIIVVSEQSGIISLATAGSLTRYLSRVELEGLLKYMIKSRGKVFANLRRSNVS